MQVILLQAIRGLGTIGQEVKVTPGYARNFLIPTQAALYANDENRAYFSKVKEEIVAKNGDSLAKAQSAAKKVAGKAVTIVQSAGDDNKLYGSVTPQAISAAVKAKFGVDVDKKHVLIANQIKFIGAYTVKLELHPEVLVEINVGVGRTDEEAAKKLQVDAAA
jgi:large subunit ribosomal protein L9